MKRIAFLSTDSLEGYVIDDELALEPLAALGWRVETVSWRQTAIPWEDFDAVVIRTTWDYQKDPRSFLEALERIHRSTRLENSLELVRWNLEKRYLRDLERRGIGIVPTIWGESLADGRSRELFAELGAGEVVVKPVIGASAGDVFRLARTADDAAFDEVEATFAGQGYMAQPLMPGILEEGEFSLMFFAGELSHAILKSPGAGDFRVQEELGGRNQLIEAEPLLLQRAREAFAAIGSTPLYARVDMVRADGDDFVLMELELIEPSLYLRMDTEAAERFAGAVDAWMES